MKKIKIWLSDFKKYIERKEGSIYIRQFYRNNKINMLVAYMLSACIAITNIGIAFIMKLLLEVVAQKDIEKLIQIIFIAVAYLLVDLLLSLLNRFFYSRYVRKAISQYKEKAFSDILKKNISSFNNEITSKYLSAFSNDVEIIENAYIKGSMSLFSKIIYLLGGLFSMICLDWILAIFTLLSCLLSLIISFFMSEKLVCLEKETSKRNEEFLNFMKNMLSGFSVIKSFKAEKAVYRSFCEGNEQLENIKKEKKMETDLIYALSRMSSYITNFIVFVLGGYFSIIGRTSIGTIIAFIQLLNYVLSPLEKIGPQYIEKKAAKTLVYKLENSMVNLEMENAVIKRDFVNGIQFSNVSYGYIKGKDVLKDISISFELGKSYAIVGESGSGKSTLINLLLGYSKEYNGEILVDDAELCSLSIESLYKLFSVIQQNVFIFDDTVKNNITMFSAFSDEEVQFAVKKAGLKEFIKEKGLNYICGENGCNLSGGEKQRISIARCILRKSPIILMDEATSSLDKNTSSYIEKEVLNLREVTKIVVTHSLEENLLRLYDQIIVISKGKIVENGNFEKLLERKGYFYTMFNSAHDSR